VAKEGEDVSRTVFIVGAGASVEAGAPVMADFLDRADGLRRATNNRLSVKERESFDLVFKGIAALRAVHSKAALDVDNLESVFGAFEMARLSGRLVPLTDAEVAGLNPAMRRLIVTTLEKSIQLPVSSRQVRPPRPYSEFSMLVGKISDSHLGPVSFITFNYDLGLDYMLHFHQTPVDYCFDEKPQGGVPLMKLHGSVNWGRCAGCGKIAPWTLQAFFQKVSWDRVMWDDEVKHAWLDVGAKISQYEHCSGQKCEPDPVIVPPTWNKSEYQQVVNVWRHASRHLSEAENIFVIGYSLPDADQFFRYMFALGTIGDGRPQRFWVVDPDPQGGIADRFQALLGPAFKSRFRRFRMPFAQAIPQVEAALQIPSRD
jgi:NAD-dependent SIR2 family protein deacetylase